MLKKLQNLHKNTLSIQRYSKQTIGRDIVEEFIAKRFSKEHDALITEFLPVLIAVHDGKGNIIAAAGVRCGSDSKLFLEDYLNDSIEKKLKAIDSRNNASLKRDHIAEIGNLASCSLAGSRFLFRELFKFCSKQNYQWVVFTSCRRLRKVFEHLNLPLIKIAEADESRLSPSKGQWGQYYRGYPAVMAGYLPNGRALAADLKLNQGVHYV